MSALPDPSASRAVLIGTSRYTHPSLEDLPAVAANLDALAALLRSPDVWGLPAENCVVVTDPTGAAEMIGPIVRAAAEATDTLLIYYAGHGLVARLASELHLALTGSEKPNASYTAVPYGLIREELAGTRAERQVVVLDCCYSGRALGRMAGGDPAEIVADEALVEGTYLIAAAAETRTAVSVPGERYTAFTAELLTLLRRGLPGHGPYLDLDTLYRQIQTSLRAKQRPLPQSRARNTAGRLAFRNRAFNQRHEHWRDLLAEAERTARTLANPEDAFAWIIGGLAAHEPAEAESLARTITDRENREFRLSQVAEEWARTDPAEAERIARTITDPESRASTLATIAGVAAGPDPAMAERLARTITFPWRWAWALRAIAESLIGRSPGRALELLDEVERFVRTNTDPQERATGLCANAVVLVKHDPGRAVELMAEAEHLFASTSTDGGIYGGLFDRYLAVKEALVVMAAFAPVEIERFVRDLVTDADPDDRASMVTTVIEDLAECAPATAERVARIVNGQNLRSFYVDRFIGTLAEQDPDAAERVIRAVVTREEWGHPLCSVARTLVERDPRRAGELLVEAEQLIRGHDRPVTGLAAVAGGLARLDPSRATRLLAEAEHLVRTGLDAETADAMAKGDAFRRSPAVIARLWESSSLRVIAAGWAELDAAHAAKLLTEVAHHDDRISFSYVLVDETIKTLARRDSAVAIRVARLLRDGYDQESAIEDIITVLAAQDHLEAERIACTVTDPDRRSRALQIVVKALIGRDLGEAERIARSVPEPHTKIHMLGLLAVSLA